MTTREKLQEVVRVLNNVYDSTMETDGSRDRWNHDVNIIEAILATLSNGMSTAEIGDANRIYKTWKNFGQLTEAYTESKYDFKNKHFAFTGFRDAALVTKLNTKYGSVVHNSITSSTKLDYLICTDTSHQTVKMKRAQLQGAVIMTREELLKLI